ncbi:MAG: metalloregulator ArsR/SmtB family transcription factor [Alphaproteobacteria bacterium]
MDIQKALIIFDALSQETRLKVFRLLINAGPKGMAAGKLGCELGVAHNTLSFHLKHLCKAKIIKCKKEGRFVIYSADFKAFREVIEFMVKDCCSPEYANIYDDKEKQCAVIELSDLCLPEE